MNIKTKFLFTLASFCTIGLFFSSASLAQEEKPLVFLECERPANTTFYNARAIVAKDWNIKYKVESGCGIDQSFVEYVKSNNKKNSVKLSDIHGEDWREKYDAEIEKEVENQELAQKLLLDVEKIAQVDSTHENFQIILNKRPNQVYAALILAQDEWEGKPQIVLFYKVLVDLKTQSVDIKSDTKQPLR